MASTTFINHHMVTHERWENFTQTDHNTWKILFERQSSLLQQRAAKEVIQGLEKLEICNDQIPKFRDINRMLKQETGFVVVPVKGLIPEDLFFQFLSERKFPSTCFIRNSNQLDYLEEPDIFHDVFGHIPLLVHPVFADFMQLFGRKGLEAIELGMLKFAATLYWFTVEFGLIQSTDGLRIYGGGIGSSKGESIYCLDSELPTRVKFNTLRVMKTQYHIDSFQRTYFVIESFQQLFDALHNLNWQEVGRTCMSFPEIAQGIALNDQEKI
ncbi:phenylalanine 4-monooxygenase [Rickettsiales endosymbiont of Peranema trichophorum]|uniref:phenylalanine 4-monooxygenase n=1 Tax=Rickettsiales endosymbiont of Peranema trichophorum TaxID=2486577 RepID=UPI001022F927|nr:phenylalanine 4-monooxygenase [Rickettsiales endosymbiont of Peranema trichophorum]RZI47201.1 phenylalanine 4-monooxygenase [Rickettsiales endosymbiont of Peranema trichophorum]